MAYTARCYDCKQDVCTESSYSEARKARDDHFDETGHRVTVKLA